MSTFKTERIDSTQQLATALKMDHADALEAIKEILPELPEGALLTRYESMQVTDALNAPASYNVLLELRK